MISVKFARRKNMFFFSALLFTACTGIWPAQWSGVFVVASETDLNEQQVQGEQLFLQRCSICHLPPAVRLNPGARPVGPDLTSLLKDTDAQNEKAVRAIILQGGPRMPGFQYGLSPQEMDDLMVYLKTL